MLNILQIEDRLKDMSQDSVMEALNNPNPVIPPFMALAELNRRKRMSDNLAMQQAQNQQTVKDQVVAGAGMPTEMASQMATAMSPQSDITGNTGLESMMQSNTMPSEYNDDIAMMDEEFEEEPMGMRAGGLIAGGPNKAGGGAFLQALAPVLTGAANLGKQFIPKFLKPKAPKPFKATDSMIDPKFIGPPDLPRTGPKVGSNVIRQLMRKSGVLGLPGLFVGGDDDEEDEDETDYTDMRKYDDLDDGGDDDAPVTQPPPDQTFSSSYIPQLMKQLQEDREALKAGRDQDMGLAMMTAGLKIADRGQLSEGVAGVEQLAQANQAYRENLRNLSGLGVQAGVAGDTIAQKAASARMSYDKAIELAQMMGAGDVIKGVGTIGDQLALVNATLRDGMDELGNELSPERITMLKAQQKGLEDTYNMLIAKLGGELGKDVIASP